MSERIKEREQEKPLSGGKILTADVMTNEEIVKKVLKKTLDKMVDKKFENLRGTYRIDDFTEEQKQEKKKEIRKEFKKYYGWLLQNIIPEIEHAFILKDSQFEKTIQSRIDIWKSMRIDNRSISAETMKEQFIEDFEDLQKHLKEVA